MLLARIIDDAFGLGTDAPLPRTPQAFEELVKAGAVRMDTTFRLYADAISRVSSELDSTLRALRSAAKHPGATKAIAEIRAHLEQLLPLDLLASAPMHRLEHIPRYLRAARARLERAIPDPRKDAEKLAAIAPLLDAFLAKQATARDREAVESLRWSFEELRVAVFAPELKTAVPVSIAKMTAAVAALR
jgi:ATP-dependent helicase HrpA